MAVLPFIRHLCICVPTVTDKDNVSEHDGVATIRWLDRMFRPFLQNCSEYALIPESPDC